MLNTAVSTVLQLAIGCLIAFVVWLMFGRKRSGLRDFLGLSPAPWSALGLGMLLGLAGAALLLSFSSMRELAGGEGSVAAAARGDTFAETAATIVLLAVFKTAFAEELLFRGILGKRLIGAFGFLIGNTLQAAAFGAVHLVLFISPAATPVLVWSVVAFSASLGWLSGWLNERRAGGSIMPGWVAHASANVASYSFVVLQCSAP